MLKKAISFLIDGVFILMMLALSYYAFISSQVGLENDPEYAFSNKLVMVFSAYFALTIASYSLSYFKPFKYILIFLIFPVLLLSSFLPIITSFFRMSIGIFVTYITSFLILDKVFPKMDLELTKSVILYCCITFTIISYSFLGNKISYWVLSFFDKNQLEVSERYADIFDQNKFSYLIYVLAFATIIFISFCDLNNIQLLSEMEEIKKAVYYSFATFIAWDRLLTKKSLFKTEGLLKRITEDFLNKHKVSTKGSKDDISN